MTVLIQTINAGIIGVALAMGLVALLHGINLRQYRIVRLYLVSGLALAVYAWSVMEMGASTDIGRTHSLLHLSDYAIFAFFGVLPLLYRRLHGQEPGRFEFALSGLYGMLAVCNLFIDSGFGWQPVESLVQVDLGWLGKPFEPVLKPTIGTYPLFALHTLVTGYCIHIACESWHKKSAGRWLLLGMPVVVALLLPVNIGVMMGLWSTSMVINPIGGVFLYIGIGVLVINQLGQIRRERDSLIRHLSEREASLSASENRFHQLFDGAADALYLCDSSGRIRDINLAACQSMGYTREELLCLFIWDIEPFLDEGGFRNRWNQIERDGAMNVESLHRCRDGSAFPVDLRIIPFRQEQKPLLFASARDIRGRKAEELERQSLEERLQQASKLEAIGRLAGGVAHDFKNLLTAMLASLDLARWEMAPDSAAHRSLDGIGKAIEKASTLTHQLLAFSRRQVMETRLVSLNDLLNDMGEILKRCLGGEIMLEMDLAGDLGMVRVDPSQFEQIVMNLVVNAKDAMPNGGYLVIKTFQTELKHSCHISSPELPAGRYACLVVSDSGEGMSADVQDHIFEPFFTTKPKYKGTGLGLAMVFGTLKQLGGGIQVHSKPGFGTAFHIYLPLAEDEAHSSVSVEGPRLQKRMPMQMGGSETILMVEDEEWVRQAGVKLLEKMGYNVLVASGGREAIEKYLYCREVIHLVMTDVMMPGMNGKELAEIWTSERPETPVLFVSGYTDNILGDHLSALRGVHFLEKPYSRDTLSRKIREVLDGNLVEV